MRITIARHAQTAYNAALRMQGHMAHTPLTRSGIAQAERMGKALGADPNMSAADYDIWSSPSGRTLQTAAIIAEHLGRDFFGIRTDARLLEIDIGTWEGRLYSDVIAETGPIMCPDRGVFTARPPGGEWYPAIADRLRRWIADLDPERNVLVISHGVTLRVLRGLLAGGEEFEGVRIADNAPQGTIFRIEDGVQSIVHLGDGSGNMMVVV